MLETHSQRKLCRGPNPTMMNALPLGWWWWCGREGEREGGRGGGGGGRGRLQSKILGVEGLGWGQGARCIDTNNTSSEGCLVPRSSEQAHAAPAGWPTAPTPRHQRATSPSPPRPSSLHTYILHGGSSSLGVVVLLVFIGPLVPVITHLRSLLVAAAARAEQAEKGCGLHPGRSLAPARSLAAPRASPTLRARSRYLARRWGGRQERVEGACRGRWTGGCLGTWVRGLSVAERRCRCDVVRGRR